MVLPLRRPLELPKRESAPRPKRRPNYTTGGRLWGGPPLYAGGLWGRLVQCAPLLSSRGLLPCPVRCPGPSPALVGHGGQPRGGLRLGAATAPPRARGPDSARDSLNGDFQMTAPGRGPVVFLQQASRPFHLSVGLVVGLGAGVLLILHLLNQSPAFAAWASGSRAEVASGPAWLQRLKTAQVVITKLGLIATAKTRRGDSLDTVQQAQQRTLDSLETKPGVAGPALTACEAVVATCSAKADQYQQ